MVSKRVIWTAVIGVISGYVLLQPYFAGAMLASYQKEAWVVLWLAIVGITYFWSEIKAMLMRQDQAAEPVIPLMLLYQPAGAAMASGDRTYQFVQNLLVLNARKGFKGKSRIVAEYPERYSAIDTAWIMKNAYAGEDFISRQEMEQYLIERESTPTRSWTKQDFDRHKFAIVSKQPRIKTMEDVKVAATQRLMDEEEYGEAARVAQGSSPQVRGR